jgi:hypothetical protein
MLNLENEPCESRQWKFLSNSQDDSLGQWSKSTVRELGNVQKYPQILLKISHLGIVESKFLLNSNIYCNEKFGLATRLDLVCVFVLKINFMQCSLKLE